MEMSRVKIRVKLEKHKNSLSGKEKIDDVFSELVRYLTQEKRGSPMSSCLNFDLSIFFKDY